VEVPACLVSSVIRTAGDGVFSVTYPLRLSLLEVSAYRAEGCPIIRSEAGSVRA
jgi:hypothetical protein